MLYLFNFHLKNTKIITWFALSGVSKGRPTPDGADGWVFAVAAVLLTDPLLLLAVTV